MGWITMTPRQRLARWITDGVCILAVALFILVVLLALRH
jgi:hypothetical protein